MLNGKPKDRGEQEYQITVYDNKTVEEKGELGSLDSPFSDLQVLCRKVAEDFRDKYRGRLNIQVIIR